MDDGNDTFRVVMVIVLVVFAGIAVAIASAGVSDKRCEHGDPQWMSDAWGIPRQVCLENPR